MKSHSAQTGKEETVYVLADAQGSIRQVIVSNWVKNGEGSDMLPDVSDLSNIENVKGYEDYTPGENGTLTWEAQGSDIYYQGTSDKELPVDVKLSYTLDGQEIAPEELAGKSGRVTIRFDYENREKQTVSINGREEEIYVPFAMISGMVLPSDTFSNVEATNARLISEGDNLLAVGVAFPGLRDSLNLEELKEGMEDEEKRKELDELNIPEYIEISADAVDFDLNMTMTMAMSDVLSDISLTNSIDLNDINESMDDLESASRELIDGTAKLKDGTGELKDGTVELKDGTGELKNGAAELKDGTGKLLEGALDLKDGTNELQKGVSARPLHPMPRSLPPALLYLLPALCFQPSAVPFLHSPFRPLFPIPPTFPLTPAYRFSMYPLLLLSLRFQRPAFPSRPSNRKRPFAVHSFRLSNPMRLPAASLFRLSTPLPRFSA